jgi:hypothetical protein
VNITRTLHSGPPHISRVSSFRKSLEYLLLILKHDHSHMCSRRGRSSWQTMQGRAPRDENADLDLDATGGASVTHGQEDPAIVI